MRRNFFSSYLLTFKRCLHPRGEVSPLSWAGRLVVRLPYPLGRTWVISLGTRLNNAWTTCENERKQRKPSLFWSTLLSPTWKLNLISWSGCTKVVITGNFYVSALSGSTSFLRHFSFLWKRNISQTQSDNWCTDRWNFPEHFLQSERIWNKKRMDILYLGFWGLRFGYIRACPYWKETL